MIQKKKTIKNDNNGIVYCTPADDVVQLPKIHLIDQFRKYKDAILSRRLSISDFAAVIGLWLPIITKSNFEGFGSVTSDTIKGGYWVLAIIITLIILKPLLIIGKTITSPESRVKYEIDPEIRVKNIISTQGTPEGISVGKNEIMLELIKRNADLFNLDYIRNSQTGKFINNSSGV